MPPRATKVLFICSRNRKRSLTAEEIFRGRPGLEIRSAGTQPSARVRVTEGLLRWADLVLVMEKGHLARLRERYAEMLEERTVRVLHIPDEYEYMQPELIDELLARAEPWLTNQMDGGSSSSP